MQLVVTSVAKVGLVHSKKLCVSRPSLLFKTQTPRKIQLWNAANLSHRVDNSLAFNPKCTHIAFPRTGKKIEGLIFFPLQGGEPFRGGCSELENAGALILLDDSEPHKAENIEEKIHTTEWSYGVSA